MWVKKNKDLWKFLSVKACGQNPPRAIKCLQMGCGLRNLRALSDGGKITQIIDKISKNCQYIPGISNTY